MPAVCSGCAHYNRPVAGSRAEHKDTSQTSAGGGLTGWCSPGYAPGTVRHRRAKHVTFSPSRAVQHERGPRNSTIRKQLAQYIKDTTRGDAAPPACPAFLGAPYLPVRALVPVTLAGGCAPEFSHSTIFQPVPRYPVEVLQRWSCKTEPVQESAARLLNMTLHWVRSIPTFLTLSSHDQHLLLQSSWPEMFLLGLAQWALPMDPKQLAVEAGLPCEQTSPGRLTSFLQQVQLLQDTLHKFHHMQLDAVEYACLKGIVLFKTDVPSLREPGTVAVLQDQTQLSFSHHIEVHKPGQPFRFGKLLLLLSSLREVQCSSLESVFFTKMTTGAVSMDQLVLDMYKSLQAEDLSDSYRSTQVICHREGRFAAEGVFATERRIRARNLLSVAKTPLAANRPSTPNKTVKEAKPVAGQENFLLNSPCGYSPGQQ
ncbi:Nuclear receptor sub 2 group E member 1 [Branchiostoma belcheri]|nr:Nuclear receptor sub 2 group E member 1 [Branchiostoma belcheri]